MLRLIAIALATLWLAAPAQAQTSASPHWPNRPIRWIVPYPPGGGTDLVSRAVGQKLSEYLGQPVVIENKPGANTIIGTSALAQAEPDGYTIALIADSHSINVAAGRKTPYDSEKDFIPIVQLLRVPFVLIANSEKVPQKTLPEIVSYAQAHPGWLTFGSLGPGSPHEIAAMWLRSIAKVDMLIVPYRGVGPALQDTVAGHVKLMLLGVSTADEMIKAGRVHPVATTSGTRLDAAPDLPTVAEQGYPEYEFVTWYGVVAPRGTPPEIVARFNREINRAMADPEVKARIASAGGDIVGGTADHFDAMLHSDVAKYRKIFALTGLKLD
jgi:tripartite-type tricarboxylate transporter receptor subunit TctC